jgi:diaminopimelate decarboxylase
MSAFDPAVFSLNSRFTVDHLTIGGVSATDLAAEFGTPLYVVDEADFLARAKDWKAALESAPFTTRLNLLLPKRLFGG